MSNGNKPWFNIAGFAQPEVVINLLNRNDYNGFGDSCLYTCDNAAKLLFKEFHETQTNARGKPLGVTAIEEVLSLSQKGQSAT